MPRNDEIARLPEYLEQLDDAGVDALIVADLGAFTLAGKYAPHCEKHISTQQSIANYVCAQAWFDLGAKRVVLARECSLEEIRAIRQKVDPALEIETFGHGAMCVSYSGRCLLSNYMTSIPLLIAPTIGSPIELIQLPSVKLHGLNPAAYNGISS